MATVSESSFSRNVTFYAAFISISFPFPLFAVKRNSVSSSLLSVICVRRGVTGYWAIRSSKNDVFRA